MAFDITKYIEENKFELGTVKKEVGNSTYKGGHNDLRKTQYDVKLTEDGKLDLYTHKEVEASYTRGKLNEAKPKQVDPVIVADIFARYLIGNRDMAIRQLEQMKDYAEFGIMEAPGTKEFNNQFQELISKIAKAIKSSM